MDSFVVVVLLLLLPWIALFIVEKSWLKSGKNRVENRGNRMLKTQNFGSAGLNAAALL